MQGESPIYRLLRALVWALLLSSFLVGADIHPTQAQNQSGITSPATGSSVGGAVPILGTAVIEPFQKYELHFKQEPSSDDAYIYFAGSTEPVINGQLGVLQSDSLPPGVYSIRLRVVKNDGNYAEFFAKNINISLEPTATPTSSEPTATPIPTATFTPAPQPTAVVGQVGQPQAGDAAPVNTPATEIAIADEPAQSNEIVADTAPDAEPNANADAVTVAADANNTAPEEVNSITRQLGEALSIQHLREQFFYGVRLSAALFTLIGLIFLGKWILSWMRAQI
ncbi:MAG: hypothetical protein H6641_10820 [Caldilineaceae bacterium]|nr:hypothetical protein [Caldilineaceae bacterium]